MLPSAAGFLVDETGIRSGADLFPLLRCQSVSLVRFLYVYIQCQNGGESSAAFALPLV